MMAQGLDAIVQQYRKWKQRHPEFPLTVHTNGQWSKKVRGRVYYFGLLDDPDAALGLWIEEKDYLLAGLIPPTHSQGMTVGELCEKHLTELEERIAAGTLAAGSGANYRSARKLLAKAGLEHTAVCFLTPEHFSSVQRQLESCGHSLRTRTEITFRFSSSA